MMARFVTIAEHLQVVSERDALREELAVIRRTEALRNALPIKVGGLEMDVSGGSASVNGRRIHLTPKEFDLLRTLADRPNHTFTKEALVDALYNGMDEPGSKIIDVFICKLRHKIDGCQGVTIETMWGRGYRLVPSAEVRAA